MDKKTRQNLLLIACGVAMFAAATNLNIIRDFLVWLGGLLLPVLAGLVLAFVLSVPMNGIRRGLERLFSKAKRKPGNGVPKRRIFPTKSGPTATVSPRKSPPLPR